MGENTNVEAADAAGIELISGNNQSGEVNETFPDPLVVEVTDEFGNPVSGVTVNYSSDSVPSDAEGQQLSPSSATTDADGRASSDQNGQVHNAGVSFSSSGSASVPVTLTTEATHTLTVDVDGVSGDESVSVTVVAPGPDNVSVEVLNGTAAADGSEELEFRVTVEDSNENPVSGVTVVASDNGDDISYPSGSSLETDGSGQVTFTATSTTAQSDVTFTFTEQDNSNSATAQGSFTDGS